ncbi:N-acetyltransferase family 8 member 3-like [Lycorma delicatula]|uniref:N-acetyltransferase family 8 member 3-like n=1 Tax=Lycorma delicatula TaxID=130591 RepID=UPI003F5152C1
MQIIMERFIVIRDYKPGDESQCYEVVKEGTMSTVNAAFVAGLTREITFQIMVLASAVMFIFLGIPIGFCLGSIPGVIVFMYFCVWSGHKYKAVEMSQDLSNIPRVYMSSDYTGFWVAEAYEPVLMINDRSLVKYTFLNEEEFKKKDLSRGSYFKKIVGTVAITRSKVSEDCAWLRRMAVTRDYQCKGIASALLNEVLKFCHEKNYNGVELVTTECHDVAREFYVKKGFELKQMYHKQLLGSLVTILMYELFYKVKTNKVPVPP